MSEHNRGTDRLFTGLTGDGTVVPAATVVLLRDDAEGGPPETLMLRKNKGQAFGGMWVFPGGKVDDGDDDGSGDERALARNAAVREAAEETGLALDPADLVVWSHWIPPPEAPRRFSTWFFVAALPPGAADVIVDGGEIGDHVWTTPAAALERHRAGEVELAPPTWVTLHAMADLSTPAAVLDAGRGTAPTFFATRLATVDGDLALLWAGDAGYESGDPDAPGSRHRLVTAAAGWRYERSS